MPGNNIKITTPTNLVVGKVDPATLKLAVPDVNQWLQGHAVVSNYIVWQRPKSATAPSAAVKWGDWNAEEKAQLKDAFAKAWNGKLSTDAAPYPNLINPPSNDHPSTWLAVDIARQHYMETIACCLMAELSPVKLAWSLATLNDQQKSHLLDSRSLFEWSESFASQEPGSAANPHGYVLKPWVLPARPGYMLKVLVEQGILNRKNQTKTIVNMVQWCGTLFHFAGLANTFEFENHWHYRGYSPISRVVEGTIPTPAPSHPVQNSKAQRWTAGCFGTTGLMSHLLRLVNIPVEKTVICDHTLPKFSSIHCWLSHGDDPYFLKHHPEIKAEQLLLDQATFDAWFGPNVPNACDNVGRRVTDLLKASAT